ncbi:MAG: 16S rRNA (guanine(966)-N(2))-methyltransferase RsmD [Deltaproteobacteria bacterium]|jgi:16S rRNA (guanine966-N2)-methyltransferase|nr:16S rRNA (guanine(966)-N(2))-methyltransferase RsmD [Deltaproteobacteria bacterium]
MSIRIIGGELKGRKLVTVPGIETRPTADRVRESIFNILGDRVRGACVLDLYAGTGAMGIEALSRGAQFAYFADDHKTALAALAKNLNRCSLENRAKTIKWNICDNLNILRSHPSAFNLVFIDPPYNRDLVQPTLSNLASSQCLANGARLALEHSPLEPIAKNRPEFDIADQRRYGKTLVSFLIYML